MGHVNPGSAVSFPRKDGWRWETTNSEYGKFYVRKDHREVRKGGDDSSQKFEELTNELLEARAQLEKLKISCVRSICGPVGLHDTACQTSPPTRKLHKTEKKNEREGNEGHSHLVKSVKPKLPLLKLRGGKSNQGDSGDRDRNRDMDSCKHKMPLGCTGSGSGSGSPTPGSAKGSGPTSAAKRKILQKQEGSLKKQKASMIKGTSNLKHTAAGGANLPPTQRYNFYRQFGYAGQGAKTSKDWHPKTTPWM